MEKEPGIRKLVRSVFIARHGDRYDRQMGSESWQKIAVRPLDPPLSEIGIGQAREIASHLSSSGQIIDHIIVSPYLRCLQTANPVSIAFGLSLNVDYSLMEVEHLSRENLNLPSLLERAAYFPTISLTYESVFHPEEVEPFPTKSIARSHKAINSILSRFPEGNLLLVSHAAVVISMAASLLRLPLSHVPSAHPCSLYRLDLYEEEGEEGEEREEWEEGNEGGRGGGGDGDSKQDMKTESTSGIEEEERERNEGGRKWRRIRRRRWELHSEFSGSISHLSHLGVTRPWPCPQKDTTFLLSPLPYQPLPLPLPLSSSSNSSSSSTI